MKMPGALGYRKLQAPSFLSLSGKGEGSGGGVSSLAISRFFLQEVWAFHPSPLHWKMSRAVLWAGCSPSSSCAFKKAQGFRHHQLLPSPPPAGGKGTKMESPVESPPDKLINNGLSSPGDRNCSAGGAWEKGDKALYLSPVLLPVKEHVSFFLS